MLHPYTFSNTIDSIQRQSAYFPLLVVTTSACETGVPPDQQLNNRVDYADDLVGWTRFVSNQGGKDREYVRIFHGNAPNC